MCSVIDNNIVMWDVGESGVKIVCTAVLDGKGMQFCILFVCKNIFKIKVDFCIQRIIVFNVLYICIFGYVQDSHFLKKKKCIYMSSDF